MRKLRILLVDDHEAVREGLKSILGNQSDMDVVGEAADGYAAVARATELSPDIIVLDVSMPRLNGLKTTEALQRCCPASRILALTRHTEDAYLQQMLRAGVSAYVLKQSRALELLHAIRALASGGSYVDPAVAGKLIGGFAWRRQHPQERAPEAGLSAREEEVLRQVAWGYSNKEIAARLELSVKTVETHKARAMQKLGLSSRIEIIKFALLQGWLQDT